MLNLLIFGTSFDGYGDSGKPPPVYKSTILCDATRFFEHEIEIRFGHNLEELSSESYASNFLLLPDARMNDSPSQTSEPENTSQRS
jgi:hypothetical protein